MIEDLGGVTSRLVTLALDAAMQRHHVIANNIANVNSEGFRPHQVEFETFLRQQLSVRDVSFHSNSEALKSVLGEVQHRLNSGELINLSEEGTVELDQEMMKMTENVLRYQALLSALETRGSIMRMAITG